MTKIDKPVIEWHGLYSEKYGTLITSESTGHPAKMSRGLVFKIYEYALEMGYIKSGDWILDPFFGVGCTALPALMHGINIWGNELEPFFTDCARGCNCTGISKAEWVRFYGRWRRAAYKSRHFCPQCITQAEQPVKATELPLSNASKKRRTRIAKLEASLRDKGKPRRATLVNPIPFPEKFIYLPKQSDMFGFVLEASYERNSHIIPHTTPHHYTGNLENWRKYAKGGAQAICTIGDSRRLTSIVKEHVGGVVSSPPFNDSLAHKVTASDTTNLGIAADGSKRGGSFVTGDYGDSPSQLGNMPAGNLADALISSSPFADSIGSDDPDKRGGLYRDDKRRNDKNLTGNYGSEPGQLGTMKDEGFSASIGSPPFASNLAGGSSDKGILGQQISDNNQTSGGRFSKSLFGDYGTESGQLANLPDKGFGDSITQETIDFFKQHNIATEDLQFYDSSISSPSFAGNSGGRGEASRNGIDPALFDRSSGGMKKGTGDSGNNLDHLSMTGFKEAVGGLDTSPPFEGVEPTQDDNFRYQGKKLGSTGKHYGNSNGQIANDNPVTFWAASRDILLQCWQLLRPGAYSFWVVKAYIKNGKVVDFPGQWLKVCEVCGFEHVETIIAWQTEDKGTNYDLDGGKQKKVVRRQSFFRLLHIKNHPELAIDCEIVLVMRKHPHR